MVDVVVLSPSFIEFLEALPLHATTEHYFTNTHCLYSLTSTDYIGLHKTPSPYYSANLLWIYLLLRQ